MAHPGLILLRPRGKPSGNVARTIATLFRGNLTPSASPAPVLDQEGPGNIPSSPRLSPVDPPWQSSEAARRLQALGWRVVSSQVVNTTYGLKNRP